MPQALRLILCENAYGVVAIKNADRVLEYDPFESIYHNK